MDYFDLNYWSGLNIVYKGAFASAVSNYIASLFLM